MSAPSYLRSIVVMPSVLAFIGIAAARAARRIGGPAAAVGALLGAAVVGVTAAADLPAQFGTWARHKEVQAIIAATCRAGGSPAGDERGGVRLSPDHELTRCTATNPPEQPRVVLDAFANIVSGTGAAVRLAAVPIRLRTPNG